MSDRPIVIHSAMSIEIKFLIEKLDNLTEMQLGNYIFYEGYIYKYPIVICVSGVGTVNTAGSIMHVIEKYNPLCVINIGIVGSCDKNIHQNDLIIGNRCLNINSYKTSYRSKGEGSDYKNWEYITFKEGVDELLYWDADKVLLRIANDMVDRYFYGSCFKGVIGSGDCWNDEVDRVIFLNDKYKVSCMDMECISIYMLCNVFKVPCISFKVVSDNIILGESYDRGVSKNIWNYIDSYMDKVIKSKDLLKNF